MYKKYKCPKCSKGCSYWNNGRLCRQCLRAFTIPLRDGHASTEGLAHKELKNRATSFLYALGCHTVRKEVYRHYVYDVMGWGNGHIYVVECGNTPKKRMDIIKKQGYIVYIWTYGALKPVRLEL